MSKFIYIILTSFLFLSDATSSEGQEYVAVSGIPEAEAQRFITQALSIVETIRSAWRETVTFPQLAMSFLLAANAFPDRVAFERFAAGSKYWNPQKTIFQIQWVPRVPNEERDGTLAHCLSTALLAGLCTSPTLLVPEPVPAHLPHPLCSLLLPGFESLVRSEVSLFPGIFSFGATGRMPRAANWSAEYFPITYCSPADDFIVGLDLNDNVEVLACSPAARGTGGVPAKILAESRLSMLSLSLPVSCSRADVDAARAAGAATHRR
jgi:hypothetical protein